MKTYKYLWEKFLSDENIELALKNAKRGKKQKCTKQILKEMYDNPQEYIPKIRAYAENFKNAKHKPIEIYDGISRKKRTIIVPNPMEQVVHHMVVNILKPIFMKSMYDHSYGSIPSRGGYAGSRRLRKWLPSKYVLKMDIRKYFESVDQDILIAKLSRIIKDEKFIDILVKIIRVSDKGIPLGFYTSQWFANFYLTDLDHFIAEKLGYGHYMRYMDDMVILDNSKRRLHRARVAINDYLNNMLNLEMKGNWQIFRFDYFDKDGNERGRDIDFMGYRFFREKTILRRSIMYKSSRKAKRISKKKPTWYDAAQMLSYNGWFKATDSYNFFQDNIKPYADFKKLRKIVSKHSKKARIS